MITIEIQNYITPNDSDIDVENKGDEIVVEEIDSGDLENAKSFPMKIMESIVNAAIFSAVLVVGLLILLLVIGDGIGGGDEIYKLSGNIVASFGLVATIFTGIGKFRKSWKTNGFPFMILNLMLISIYLALGIYAACRYLENKYFSGANTLSLIANVIGIVGIFITLLIFHRDWKDSIEIEMEIIDESGVGCGSEQNDSEE